MIDINDNEIVAKVYPIAHYDSKKERKLVEDSIKEAIRLARASELDNEQVKYKPLIELWKKLITLDNKHWTSENWEEYATEWAKLVKEAKVILKKVGA